MEIKISSGTKNFYFTTTEVVFICPECKREYKKERLCPHCNVLVLKEEKVHEGWISKDKNSLKQYACDCKYSSYYKWSKKNQVKQDMCIHAKLALKQILDYALEEN